MHVAVVGAGIGGLTLAAALIRDGLTCQVFEQTPVLEEVGAGIQLAPNAVRVLGGLGLNQQLRLAAVRPEALEMRRWDDNTVLRRTELGARCEEMYGAPYYTVHRAELHRRLLEQLPSGTVHLGLRCIDLRQRPREVELAFENGFHEHADVVVGADGIHSTVRDRLVPDQPRFSGQTIYRALVPADRVPFLLEEPKVVLWLGPRQHCVSYPISGDSLVSLGATTPGEDWQTESWSAKGRPEDLRARYAAWHPQVRELTAGVDMVSRWALYDRDPLPRWSDQRMTVLGDAAHPMLPFFAQGANQAIEDAAVLATCLRQAETAGVVAALARYEQIRRPRTEEVHRISRANTVALHLPDGAEQRRRDEALAAGAALRDQEWLFGYDAERVALAATA